MCINYLLEDLQNRNSISQITNKEELVFQLKKRKSILLYCGFDPTAESLHLGHLMPLVLLKRFQLRGHQPVILIGGATGLLGDPSFRIKKRELVSQDLIQEWSDKIKNQICSFLNFDQKNNKIIIVNNYDWFKNINFLDFLQKIGKYFSVNQMIGKEFIKKRIFQENFGISFSEFSYNLLQSYDFYLLNKKYGVILQIGGSDQWGNIISGINLIKKISQESVFGLTFPLISNSYGMKFSKTEKKENIWLDAKKTHPYQLYQYLINTSDNDVYNFLKIFTFLSIEEIEAIKSSDKTKKNRIPCAQYMLADEVTRMIHGNLDLKKAKRITHNLFTKPFSDLNEEDFNQLIKDGIKTVFLPKGANLQQALKESKLTSSKNQARIAIASKAILINGKRQTSTEYEFKESDIKYHRFTLLCKGKKNFCLICWK